MNALLLLPRCIKNSGPVISNGTGLGRSMPPNGTLLLEVVFNQIKKVLLKMKKIMNLMLAVSVALFATVALTACDDDDAAAGNQFVIQNN